MRNHTLTHLPPDSPKPPRLSLLICEHVSGVRMCACICECMLVCVYVFNCPARYMCIKQLNNETCDNVGVSVLGGQPIDETWLGLTSRLGRNPSQSDVLPEYIRAQSPGSLHPPDTGRNPRQTGCPFLRDLSPPWGICSALWFGSGMAKSQTTTLKEPKSRKEDRLMSPGLKSLGGPYYGRLLRPA